MRVGSFDRVLLPLRVPQLILAVGANHGAQPVGALPDLQHARNAAVAGSPPRRDGGRKGSQVGARDAQPAVAPLDLEDVERNGHTREAQELAQGHDAVRLGLQVVELDGQVAVGDELQVGVGEGGRVDGAGEDVVGS